ncbi:hypothetical protein ACFO9Q_12140 [Paenibacillus sp. GCM10023252]|uniref:hypothetical protein n=1 Tax=Paenibacillus sp. GCM10023252 TaxID=3252649 RepID=UPI00361513DA
MAKSVASKKETRKLTQLKARDKQSFLLLSDEVSRILRRIILTLLVVAAMSQMALQNEQIRYWVTSVDRLEGTKLQ